LVVTLEAELRQLSLASITNHFWRDGTVDRKAVAEEIIRVAHESLGISTFIHAEDIATGHSNLCMSFVAQLFNAIHALPPALHVVEEESDEEESPRSRTLSRASSTGSLNGVKPTVETLPEPEHSEIVAKVDKERSRKQQEREAVANQQSIERAEKIESERQRQQKIAEKTVSRRQSEVELILEDDNAEVIYQNRKSELKCPESRESNGNGAEGRKSTSPPKRATKTVTNASFEDQLKDIPTVEDPNDDIDSDDEGCEAVNYPCAGDKSEFTGSVRGDVRIEIAESKELQDDFTSATAQAKIEAEVAALEATMEATVASFVDQLPDASSKAEVLFTPEEQTSVDTVMATAKSIEEQIALAIKRQQVSEAVSKARIAAALAQSGNSAGPAAAEGAPKKAKKTKSGDLTDQRKSETVAPLVRTQSAGTFVTENKPQHKSKRATKTAPLSAEELAEKQRLADEATMGSSAKV
jgi:hypothetical protein